jgi:aspartate aminotransferase
VVAPTDVIEKMNNFLQHVGTWAPRAEQVATARLLMASEAIEAYRSELIAGAQARLSALHDGLKALGAAGHPVDAVAPQGAIYLSGQFALMNRRTPEGDRLETNEDVRRWLLRTAGLAVVPFNAFGATGETGWCRLSIGAASMEEIERALPRLAAGLEALR